MVTGYDQDNWRNLDRIRRELDRIADALERIASALEQHDP